MAAALVGGAFLSATLQILFDRLASREIINLFRDRKHDDKLLRELKSKLLVLNKVLNDAEAKQIDDQNVKDWLDELKDAVYHADDLVDEIATEVLRSKAEPNEVKSKFALLLVKLCFAVRCGSPNEVPSPLSTSTKLFDDEIESKLGDMIDKLEKLVKDKDVLDLREVGGQDWSHRRSPTTSLVDETRVFGREKDMEVIMKLLLSDGESSNKVDVIPIVGMGGVGKTTLAQLLFNDGRLEGHFGMKKWVSVGDVFDVWRVTRTIVEAVTGDTFIDKDLDFLQVKLKESLSGKKFLVVLDDVWNENYDDWSLLMTPLMFGAHGSKIIVTTRHESVGSIGRTVPIYNLQELAYEDCWNLFSKHAFKEGDWKAYPDLKNIGEKIVRKCKGLPLAVKTLGGLLRWNRDGEYWKAILESHIWDLPKEKSNILPALKLSYHYLPSNLKRCFAFCSIYPKDNEFDMEEVILKWIAQGFVGKPQGSKAMEEEGREYFRELLSRSLFQRSSADKSCFVMHDLVHDLAEHVIGDFCHRLEDGKTRGISEKVRHFSYDQERIDVFEKLKVIKEAKYLRTFLPLDCGNEGEKWLSKKALDILSGLTRLRLLSLSRYQIRELPHSIGNMIHLRFLDLSSTLITHLPDSVCTLYNLETLLLSNCRHLTTLPAEIVKLILLRHLDLSGTNLKEMPMHMSRLKDLQELTAFVVGERSGSGINELKELHHLRGKISISGLQNVTSVSDALEAEMREKEHLQKLTLKWGSCTDDTQNERNVLEKLKPHTNLKHLRIKNYGDTRFPDWLGDQSFNNMVSLRLENCEQSFSMPPLGQLPSLKELTIARMPNISNMGHEFYGEIIGSLGKPFPSLEILRFEEMSEWENWSMLDDVKRVVEFSRLRTLEVIDCPKLIGDLPKEVPSLVRLEIRKCPKLEASLPRTCSICELLLEECQGVQLEWQCVPSVETLEISGFASLKEFASELVTLASLKNLSIRECPSLLSFPDTGLPPMLAGLDLRDCEAMQCLSEAMMSLNSLQLLCVKRCPELVLPLSGEMSHCYTSLEALNLGGCQSLKSLGLYPKLQYLRIKRCMISKGIEYQNLTSLQYVKIDSCNNLVSFPHGGIPAPNLSTLQVHNCEKLTALPEQMCTLLPTLQNLSLANCPEIESFPEGGLPSKLNILGIWNCKKLVGGRRDWGLQKLPSLRTLILAGESEDAVESFPEEGLLPSTLTSLGIWEMPNLKSLNNKGGLQLLGSLKYMAIKNCPQLQSLPEEGLPTSLFTLVIEACPLLKHRCRIEEGDEWHKIAHVPVIGMDYEAILDQVNQGPIPPDIWSMVFQSYCQR